jgi:glutathione S-transferase
MLKLYHWSPTGHSAIALICLHAKGLAFESVFVDLLAFEQYSPDFLRVSASGQVPVLVHDGKVITQTTALTEYLDETFPEPPLMPADAVGRWKCRVWAKILNEDVSPSVSQIGWHGYTRVQLGAAPLAQLRQAASGISIPERRDVWNTACAQEDQAELLLHSQQKLGGVLKRMETELSRNTWLAGSQLSLADIQLFPMIAPLQKMLPEHLNPGTTPQLIQWLARMRALPAVRKTLGSSSTFERDELCSFVPGPEQIRWG